MAPAEQAKLLKDLAAARDRQASVPSGATAAKTKPRNDGTVR
jgi:hypothetical protein